MNTSHALCPCRQSHLEPLAEKNVAKWDRHAHQMCRKKECEEDVLKYLEEETCQFAQEVVDTHWQLAMSPGGAAKEPLLSGESDYYMYYQCMHEILLTKTFMSYYY